MISYILNNDEINKILKECKKTDLTFYEVSKDVNKPTNNSASLIQAII